MKLKLACIALFLPLAALAQSPQNQPMPNREAVRQQLFEQRKAAEIVSHQERIKILQIADACVRSANTPDAFKACEETERNSRKSFREQEHAKREQMKVQLSQLREQR